MAENTKEQIKAQKTISELLTEIGKKAKEKHEVKSELTKNDILIDDRADTIGRWEANGGTGIVYNSADQVINDLKKLGL